MNGRMGWRGAAEVHASAAAAAAQRQVSGMLWVLTRPRCARSEPATRAASKTNGGNRYLYQHPQPAAPQQAFRTLTAAAAHASPWEPLRLRRSYELRIPGSAGLDFRNSCAFHRLLSGLLRMVTEKRLGVWLLNYCCARGLEA